MWSLNYLALNVSRFEIICSDSQHLPLLKLRDMQIFNQMFRFVFMFSWGSIFKWSLQKKNSEQRRKHTPLHTTKHVTEFQIYVIKRTHTH